MRWVDGGSDSNQREDSFRNGSESEEEGEDAEEISDGINRSKAHARVRGVSGKRSNPVAENVSSGSVITSKKYTLKSADAERAHTRTVTINSVQSLTVLY